VLKFGIELEYYLSNNNLNIMVINKSIINPDEKEKEWENPIDPTKSTDERDKEQLLRQYKEAKRRKDNLTETDDKEAK
jgi:hypothetical protein